MELNKKIDIDMRDYPENDLNNRIKLSFKWIEKKVDTLLDGGCSYGYGTRFFAQKSNNTYGIDVNPVHIEIAKQRYPKIHFSICYLEDTGFQDKMFDFVILNDVLEHTKDKIKTLEEMYRILKIDGQIIISTPHKGLFAFLDPYNYGFYLRKYLPLIYKLLYKMIRFLKEGKVPAEFNPEHEQKHWHYSYKDLINMLNQTNFNGNYQIERLFRSGIILEVLVMNLESFLKIFLPQRILRIILKPFLKIANFDYWIPFGVFSYNIAIKIKKIK